MSGLGSLGIDKILGKGARQGGFLIAQNKIEQLIKYRHFLSAGQKKQILDSLQTWGQLVIRPTRKQIEGGALGAILASIGVPLAIELASKLFGRGLNISRRSVPTGSSRGGRGLQVNQKPGMLMLYQQPPFLGTWENPVGIGEKKNSKQSSTRKKQPIQRNSTFRNNPVKPPFKNIPLSNIDLQNWCNHLDIKIKGIFSRNTHMPKAHSPRIINLDDYQNTGTHREACAPSHENRKIL